MEKKYNQDDIPINWKYCFNVACPMKDHCLPFQSALEIPQERTWGHAVFPSACHDGQCDYFRKDEPVTLATGFVVSGQPELNTMFVRMRRHLTAYLGGQGTYYLYRNGKKWLSPAQQETIRQMLGKAGFRGEVCFGITKQGYDFT